MPQMGRQLGRAFALFLVGALTLFPVSASADPPGNSVVTQGKGNNEDPAPPPGEDGDAPGRSDDPAPGSGENAPGRSDDPAPGSGENAPGQSDDPLDPAIRPTQSGTSGPADPAGVADGFDAGRPSSTPSGVTPTQGGLGSVDARLLPTHLGAAIVMFDQAGKEPDAIPESVEAPMGMVSGSVIRALTSVVPPLLVDLVASPIVVIEALIEAMASSGHALLIPLIAGAAWFLTPGVRRKDLFAEALES